MTDIAEFVATQTQLVEKERDYEAAQSSSLANDWLPTELQRLGFALVALRITRVTTGLGGKSVLTLEAPTAGSKLMAHTLRTGDIVSVTAPVNKKNLDGLHGVITSSSDAKVTVALKEDAEVPSDWRERCTVRKLASDVTYRRMLFALKDLGRRSINDPVIRVLLGSAEPAFSEPPPPSFFDESLNESQKLAVTRAVTASDIALIHGPPGTGKTHSVVEVVRQLVVRQKKRVLVCGASNLAVDNLVERLASLGFPIVRLGHPARMLAASASHSLDVVTRWSERGQILRDVRTELDSTLAKIPKAKRSPERRALYAQVKDLRKEFRARERSVIDQTISGACVVLTTLSGAAGRDLARNQGAFDAVVIDEATQAVEPECWIAALQAPKLILAGDHHQLPPTIMSSGAAGPPSPLEFTMFERVRQRFGDSVCVMLETQYRMHRLIAQVSSERLYQGRLLPDSSVADHLLSDIVDDTEDTITPLVFYDTAGSAMYESSEDAGKIFSDVDSKLNQAEAHIAATHVDRLVNAGLDPVSIAVISPYNAQVRLLKTLIRDKHPTIEIGSVDGFQGREKEAVILSLVRSNETQEIGFLADYRRINVAVTRARRHLCVIGDSETVPMRNPFLKGLFEHLESHADLRYPDSMSCSFLV